VGGAGQFTHARSVIGHFRGIFPQTAAAGAGH